MTTSVIEDGRSQLRRDEHVARAQEWAKENGVGQRIELQTLGYIVDGHAQEFVHDLIKAALKMGYSAPSVAKFLGNGNARAVLNPRAE